MRSITPCHYRISTLLVVAVLVLTGCVSSKYKLAEYERRPQSLNIPAVVLPAANSPTPPTSSTASSPPLDAVVNSVIALHGPGSWKRNAYWDEYVISLANHGTTPLVLEAATLIDFQGQGVAPGTDPWVLEKQSRDYESRILSTAGDVVKIGSGVVLASATGLVTGAAAAAVSGTAGMAAWSLVGTGFFAAIPVYAAGTIYRNASNKHKIQEEFARRSLAVPLTLEPGKLVQGSLFFRISPGPQRLALRCRTSDGGTNDMVIELAPLARLHLKRQVAANGETVPR